MAVAYRPRAGYSAESVGTVAVSGNSLNLTDALNEGAGVLVVPDSDLALQQRLDEHPALTRTSVPKGGDAQLADGLHDVPMATLREQAKSRGLKATGNKEELHAAIVAHDARLAGDEKAADLATTNDDSRED